MFHITVSIDHWQLNRLVVTTTKKRRGRNSNFTDEIYSPPSVLSLDRREIPINDSTMFQQLSSLSRRRRRFSGLSYKYD